MTDEKKPRCPNPQCGGELIDVHRPVETQGAPIIERKIRLDPYRGRAYRSVRCSKCGINMELPITAEELLALEDADDMSGLR